MKGIYQKFRIPLTNLYMIRWYPNVVTPIHDHPNTECNFIVLKGTLQENRFKMVPNGGYYMISSTILQPHQSSHINDSLGNHTIKNLSDKDSWSLHYYKTNK